MASKNKTDAKHSTLPFRQRAENLLLEKNAESIIANEQSIQVTQDLVHELQVHQIELEMENNELREVQFDLEESKARFEDLYDSAPVGYFTVSKEGLILQANLTLSTLLGLALGELLKQPLTRFIHREDQDIFYLLRKRLSSSNPSIESSAKKQTCELRMLRADGTTFWGQLTSVFTKSVNEDSEDLNVVLLDVTEKHQYEYLLQDSERTLLEAQRIGKMGNWHLDHENGRLTLSTEVYRLLELKQEDFGGHYEDFLLAVHLDDRETINQLYAHQSPSQQPFEIEHRLRLKDGRIKWLRQRGETDFDSNGEPLYSHGIVQDVTETRQVSDSLKTSEKRFRDIAHISADWIWEVDSNAIYTYASKSVYTLLGYRPDEILGKTPFDFMPPDEVIRVGEEFSRIVATKSSFKDLENIVIGKDGASHITLTNGTPILDGHGELLGYRGVDRDITQYREMENKVRDLAFFDTLTKLPNRRLLCDRLAQSIAASKRNECYCALMFLDLDNFKQLNDSYGHDVGDLLLIEVSKRLQSIVREIDTVARYGGDEFVIILNTLNTNRSESKDYARVVAEKIIATLSQPYLLHEIAGEDESLFKHYCTASIGIVLYYADFASQDTILKQADIAMYESKGAGRNTIHFSDHDQVGI